MSWIMDEMLGLLPAVSGRARFRACASEDEDDDVEEEVEGDRRRGGG